MRLLMLGPLRIHIGGKQVPIKAPQQRTVLAVLLAKAGHPVSVEQLIFEVWGESPPPGATRTMHGYVFRLRRLIGADPQVVLTRRVGYVCDTASADRDVDHFERHVRQASQAARNDRLDDSLAHWESALDLWRGPALADVPRSPTVMIEADRLDVARSDACVEHVEVLLRLGRDGDAAATARQLIAEHPLRERLWEQLMLALARGGRRSEALQAYQQAHRILSQQVGLEPGPALRELQQTILRGSIARSATEPAIVTRVKPRVVPAQLPADIDGFTGRDTALATLDAMLNNTVREAATPPAVIAGTAGVGKTALAVNWAHRHKHRFPDGQLYANLRGFTAGPPVQPAAVLAGFLRALGMPRDQIPSNVDEASALYRSVLADRRILILLDNARDAAQVRPLLAGSPGCAVLITSRGRLTGLAAREGANILPLDVLDPQEAHRLLTTLLPRPAADDPEAIAHLARLCGHLPLALRIAAARLAMQPTKPIGSFIAELGRSDRLRHLAVVGDPETAVSVAFEHSYADLPSQAQHLFATLGSAPIIDLTARSAAAAIGASEAAASHLLEILDTASMVHQRHPGRYTLHDLIKMFAKQRHPSNRLDRLHNYYLQSAMCAAERLYPAILRLPGPAPAHTETGEFFDDDLQASQWLDAESANMITLIQHASTHGPFPLAWQMADVLRGYLYMRAASADWELVATAGLAAARADANPMAEAAAHLSHALRHFVNGDPHGAIVHYRQAEQLSRRAQWRLGQATALGNLANVHLELGQLDHAMAGYTKALSIARQAEWILGQASNLANLGILAHRLGDLQVAVDHLTQALALHEKAGSRMAHARNLANLADVLARIGRHDEALAAASQALRLHHQLGDRHTEPSTLRIIADIHDNAGRHGEARDAAQQAVEQARRNCDTDSEAAAQTALARIEQALGNTPDAIAHYRAAIKLADSGGYRYTLAQAQIGLAASVRTTEPATARALAETALAGARESQYGLLESLATTILNIDTTRHRGGRDGLASTA